MFKKLSYIKCLWSIHILIRTLCGLIVFYSLYYVFRNNEEKLFSNIVFQSTYDYQTLMAGLIAFIGALWTVSAIKKQIRLQQYQIQNERYEKLLAVKKSFFNPSLDYQEYISQIWLQKDGLVSAPDKDPKYREDLIKLINTIGYIDWKLTQFLTKLKYFDSRLHEKIGKNDYNSLDKQDQIEALAEIIILNYMIDEFIAFLNTHQLENNLPKTIAAMDLIDKLNKHAPFKMILEDKDTKNDIIKKLKVPIIIWTDNDKRKFLFE